MKIQSRHSTSIVGVDLLSRLSCAVAIWLVGCSTPGPEKPVGLVPGYASKGDVRKRTSSKQIELPFNYNQSTAYRKLKMLVKVDGKSIDITGANAVKFAENADKLLNDASLFLQSKMGYIKRFNMYAAWGDGARQLAGELQDVGDVKVVSVQSLLPQIDVFCTANIILKKDAYIKKNGADEVEFVVTLAVQMTDNKKEIIGRAQTVTGKSEKREIFYGFDGIPVGGVTTEAVGVQEAVMNALQQYMVIVGNEFPVSGKVTGISKLDPNRLQVDKGMEDGLTTKTQLVMWTKDGGVDFPIAQGEAQPGEKVGSVIIYDWSTQNAAVEKLIGQIKQPGWLEANKDALYFTSRGLGYPQEWEQTQRELLQKRIPAKR